MLLLNFANFHIQWSIEVIAMSFGITLYSFAIFLTAKSKKQLIYSSLLLLCILLIVWTHIISSFILFISIFTFYISKSLYIFLYGKSKEIDINVSLALCALVIVILFTHWMDPRYPFLTIVTLGLKNSLSFEAQFLSKLTFAGITQSLIGVIHILSFLMYIFFGIIGSLYYLSKNQVNSTKFSLILTNLTLFGMYFVFPLFGLKNIMPARWPAFIYITFVLFACVGFVILMNLLNGRIQSVIVALLLFISSFSAITCFDTNMDSPIFGQELVIKNVWTESELILANKINTTYSGIIISDVHLGNQLFETFFRNYNITYYSLNQENDINLSDMDNKLVVLRKSSMSRSISVSSTQRYRSIYFGDKIEKYLKAKFDCVFNTGEGFAYLKPNSCAIG